VQLTTSAGPITLAIDTARAPVTAANFLRYVDQRRLDGVAFYRAMRMGDGGLIQGGTRGDRARVLRPIPHEPTTQTGLSHTDMAISMARGAPGSADGDFFIIVGSQMTGLDANPAGAGDNQGFAVFGRVVAGQEVVRTILGSPTSPTEGEGVMRGQMLAPTIRITTARRVAAPAPATPTP
jgi:peptidyl-prolyl cis-trans isomerase A (cyclophilin A)